MSPRARGGFTLLEVIAVVLLTGILVAFTTNFYLDLTHQSQAAVRKATQTRRAVVLLDRIARDLESAVLVKKPGPVDPLQHPWIFLAESDDPTRGAQRIKFSSRGRRPRSPEAIESDVEMVAWELAPTDAADYQLVRWSSPRLPPARDLSFPPVEEGDPVARGIAEFGIYLIDEAGERLSRWDSSALVEASELPVAAEIEVAFFADGETDQIVGPFTRRVAFPLPPIDVEAQLEAAGFQVAVVDENGDGIPDGEQDVDGDGVPDDQDDDVAGGGDQQQGKTAEECFALNPNLAVLLARAGVPDEVVDSMRGLPASTVAAQAGFPLPENCQ